MIYQNIINSSITELYTNGGGKTYLTENYTTNYRHFWSRKVLGQGESADTYREATESEKTDYEALPPYVRPPQVFIDQWNAACRWTDDNGKTSVDGTYNEATGFFELHGITDITYEEAIRIYKCFVGNTTVKGCRTFLRLPYYYQAPRDNGNRYTNRDAVILKSMFATPFQILGTSSLREISTIFLLDAANSIVIRSSSLEYIGMSAQNASAKVFSTFDIRNASNFRLDGMSQILRWVRNSTITVHPDVYAKLTDAVNYPEWAAVTELAATKNIIFATT